MDLQKNEKPFVLKVVTKSLNFFVFLKQKAVSTFVKSRAYKLSFLWYRYLSLPTYFLKRVLVSLFFFTFFYWKSYLIYIIPPVFIVEYLWVLVFFWKICTTSVGYRIICIKKINPSTKNALQVWNEYCKTRAFLKCYTFFQKKTNINTKSILFCLFIILLRIPLRLLRIGYHFWVTEGSFRYILDVLYLNSYFSVKEHCIEILNNKIYLNPYGVEQFLADLPPICKTFNPSTLKNLVYQFKLNTSNQQQYKIVRYEEFRYAQVTTKEGLQIPNFHPTLYQNGHTLHGTSMVPKFLQPSQRIEVSLPTLIAKDATKPGTIISPETAKVKFYGSSSIWVPGNEVDSIKYEHLDIFTLSVSEFELQHQFDITNYELITKCLGPSVKPSVNFYKKLRTGLYSKGLLETDDVDLGNLIDDYRKGGYFS